MKKERKKEKKKKGRKEKKKRKIKKRRKKGGGGGGTPPMSVNYRAVFYLFDFLTFELGADTLSQNVGNELSLYGA